MGGRSLLLLHPTDTMLPPGVCRRYIYQPLG